MNSHNCTLDNAGLRNFAFITGSVVVAIFGLMFPWLFDSRLPAWPWMIAALLFILAFIRPKLLFPIYTVWMKIGLILGWINSRIILGVIFYLLILPTGIVLSLLGKDSMCRKIDVEAKSYRVIKKKRERNDLERSF